MVECEESRALKNNSFSDICRAFCQSGVFVFVFLPLSGLHPPVQSLTNRALWRGGAAYCSMAGALLTQGWCATRESQLSCFFVFFVLFFSLSLQKYTVSREGFVFSSQLHFLSTEQIRFLPPNTHFSFIQPFLWYFLLSLNDSDILHTVWENAVRNA